MNQVIVFLIKQLCDAIVGSGILDRVIAAIRRWAVAKFDEGTPAVDQNAERRHGVLDEMQQWGADPVDPCPPLSESWRRLLLELAYRLVKSEEVKA